MDTVVNCIVEHFNQKDYTMYVNSEKVLLKGTLGEFVSQMSTTVRVLHRVDTLRILVSILAESYHSFREGEGVGNTVHNVVDFLKKNKIWSLIPEVMSLDKIILVMPATNASSEHAFSALRKLKSYLRTTMSDNCLYHPMPCTVHKELVKELNLKQVTNDSVDRVEALIHLWPLYHIAVIDVDEGLGLSL